MAEWLRRLTRNQLGSPRASSNPAADVFFYFLWLSSINRLRSSIINIMVFSLLDSFFELFANPRERLHANGLAEYYRREGFTDSESAGLAWMCRQRSIGQSVGLLFGIALVYGQNPRVQTFTFKYSFRLSGTHTYSTERSVYGQSESDYQSAVASWEAITPPTTAEPPTVTLVTWLPTISSLWERTSSSETLRF